MSTERGIHITYTQALQQADSLNDCAGDLTQLNKRLDDIMQSLQSGWSGEAASAYLDRCTTLKQKVGSASAELQRISGAIRSAARAYYDAEMRALELARMDSSGSGRGGGFSSGSGRGGGFSGGGGFGGGGGGGRGF